MLTRKSNLIFRQISSQQEINKHNNTLIRSRPTLLTKIKCNSHQQSENNKIIQLKTKKKIQIQINQKTEQQMIQNSLSKSNQKTQNKLGCISIKMQQRLLKSRLQTTQIKRKNERLKFQLSEKLLKKEQQIFDKGRYIKKLQQTVKRKDQQIKLLNLTIERLGHLRQTIKIYEDIINQKQVIIRKIIKFNDYVTEKLITKQCQLSKMLFHVNQTTNSSTCDRSKGFISQRLKLSPSNINQDVNFSLQLQQSIKYKSYDQRNGFIIFPSTVWETSIDKVIDNNFSQSEQVAQLNQMLQRECITFGNR